MAKYYFILALIMGAVLYYIFLEDPCNNMVRADFSEKHPGYEILGSRAGEGTPDKVQCHIHFQKPDSEEIYEEVWLYQKVGSDWSLAGVLETQKTEQGR
jgi:hypothetical protein